MIGGSAAAESRQTGRILTGTSGFAYPSWAPRFYTPGTRADRLLPAYAARLPAVELNSTFYQRPTPAGIERWLAQTPAAFRFAVKAQRAASVRALLRDPGDATAWLTEPLPRFGERLGTVLFRVPAEIHRDDGRLAGLLAAWPACLPLTLEFQDASWRADEVHALLRASGAALCATDLDGLHQPPPLDLTGRFLYVRLRRTSYDDSALEAWAERLAPFVASGTDVYAFLRHDDDGLSPIRAERLRAAIEDRVAAAAAPGGGPDPKPPAAPSPSGG